MDVHVDVFGVAQQEAPGELVGLHPDVAVVLRGSVAAHGRQNGAVADLVRAVEEQLQCIHVDVLAGVLRVVAPEERDDPRQVLGVAKAQRPFVLHVQFATLVENRPIRAGRVPAGESLVISTSSSILLFTQCSCSLKS